MKQFRFNLLMIALTLPVIVFAQDDKGDKGDKKETQTIIITRKGVSSDKQNTTIEVKGDKVYVDGKLVDDKDKGDDVNVRVMKVKDPQNLRVGRAFKRDGSINDDFTFNFTSDDKAMLGVSTQKVESGVEVQSVTKESGAEKAGIKEKDIITMIDNDKIEDPDDLTAAVQKHKAGDKITVTVLRDKKELKLSAELTKWKGTTSMGNFDTFNFNMDDLQRYLPRTPIAPRVWAGNGPKLGLSIQDNEDGKGVKVTEVEDESNADKAGIKENDLIVEGDGKAINNADDMVNLIRQSKEKVTISLKIVRNGKPQNIEVKMPRKLRTADL
jgi:serine protease Do